MKKIVLVCNMGMSTSALMKKMREYAASVGYECTVDAYGVAEVAQHADADCILVGPQIAYQLNNIKKQLPNVPAEAVITQAYGMLDGARVIKQAQALMGE